MADKNGAIASLGFEAKLWAADALRDNMDAAEDDGESRAEGARLDGVIVTNLEGLGYGLSE